MIDRGFMAFVTETQNRKQKKGDRRLENRTHEETGLTTLVHQAYAEAVQSHTRLHRRRLMDEVSTHEYGLKEEADCSMRYGRKVRRLAPGAWCPRARCNIAAQ